MHDLRQFNWLRLDIPDEGTDNIKKETAEPTFPLQSPPLTPSKPTLSVTNSLSSFHRGSTSSFAGIKRLRPYPSFHRDTSCEGEPDIMSTATPAYGTWSNSGMRSGARPHPHHPAERRSSDGDEPIPYTLSHQFMNDPYLSTMNDSSELRPASSSSSLTSTLTGAMGETNISAHSRQSRSPPSVYGGNVQNHDITWGTNPTNATTAMSNATYPSVAGHSNMPFHNMAPASALGNLPFDDYTTARNASPESLSPPSPPYPQQFNDQQYTIPTRTQLPSGAVGYPGQCLPTSYQQPMDMSLSSEDLSENEVRQLRRRVRELELECGRSRTALEAMRGSVASSTPSRSPSFRASRKARTEARKKMFCSLNRAGNALCAWHDSRRERRAFPPRNAPPGYLNCGCTFEEALFEESLSRHGVGSYHPGETVRMDPALRNPLLKLLEKRYGYKDGDFEHNPVTSEWAEGEAPAVWEQKAHSGQAVRRRPESDRH